MTYNVFGGTLNLALSICEVGCVALSDESGSECVVELHLVSDVRWSVNVHGSTAVELSDVWQLVTAAHC